MAVLMRPVRICSLQDGPIRAAVQIRLGEDITRTGTTDVLPEQRAADHRNAETTHVAHHRPHGRKVAVVNPPVFAPDVIHKMQDDPLARDDFQAVEVIEHRLDPLRQPALIGNVPWRERPVRLRKDMHLGAEPYRPFIQVLLVAELSVLFACIAPFHAALLPPSQHARRRTYAGRNGVRVQQYSAVERCPLTARSRSSSISASLTTVAWRSCILANALAHASSMARIHKWKGSACSSRER